MNSIDSVYAWFMKNAIIIHGTGDEPGMFWFPYVRNYLESKSCSVWAPQMPHADCPNIQEWLPFVLDQGSFSDETILIGHSAGSQLILSILEHIDSHVKQSILVSGYAQSLRLTPDSEERGSFNWEAIKLKCRHFVFITSDNDPWECDDTQGRLMLDHLGGILIIPKGEGHMGSTKFDQPYREFPLLVKLLET